MVSSTSGTTDTTSTSSTTRATGMASGIGQDAFLKMFMAQITNQNPLDPMDNTEFTAQLATFSQLEQLTQINEALQPLATLQQTFQQGQAINYLGKEVTMSGNQVALNDGVAGELSFTLGEAADVTMRVYDADGNLVKEEALGIMEEGSHTYTWDGTTTAGQAADNGVYEVHILAYNAEGESVSVPTPQVTGLVTGYQVGDDGEILLQIGDVLMPLSEVVQVQLPADTSSTSTTNEEGSGSADSIDGAKTTDSSVGYEILQTLGKIGAIAAALL
ncbi:MAG: flagellar hook assembly protein FlgD [Deltaproteobacteria bacterium]|nr:flagellar hook assembly protein FlgD [Deltaproteobacteria bacterium]